jgi:exonuclease SbcC
MITGIKLRHFKSHESTELTFTEGTNLIIGQMGSGKTSVMDALCFGLYGTFPALKSRRVTLEEVVMARPTKYTEASVEVKFEAGNSVHSVERVVKKGEAQAYLRTGGQVVEAGPQRVTEAVSRLLGADYELFTRAVYSEQNKLDWFLSLGKGERKKYFDELLGINKFENARAGAAAVANRLKTLKLAAKSFLSGIDVDACRNEYAVLQSRCMQLSDSLTVLKKELAATSESFKAAQQQLGQLKAKEEPFFKAEAAQAQAVAAIAQMQSLLQTVESEMGAVPDEAEWEKRSKQAAKIIKDCTDAEKELAAVSGQLEKVNGELAQVESELERLKGSGTTGETSAIEADQLLVQSKLSQTETALAQLVRQLSAAREALGKTIAWREDSSLCEKEISEMVQALARIQEKEAGEANILKASELVQSLVNKEASINAKLQTFANSIHLLSSSSVHCPVCKSPLDDSKTKQLHHELETEQAEAKTALEETAKELSAARNLLKAAEETSLRKSQLASGLQTAREKQVKLTNLLAAVQTQADSVQPLQKNSEGLQSQINAFLAQKDALGRKLSSSKEYSRLEKLHKQIQETKAKHESAVAGLQKRVDKDQKTSALKEQSTLTKARQAMDWRKRIGQLEETKEAAEKALATIGFARAQLEEARSVCEGANLNLVRLQSETAAKELELAEKTVKLKESETRLQRIEEHHRRIKQLELAESGILKLENALADTQAALRTELVGSLNDASSALWKSIYPYGDYPNLRLTASEEDYSLELQALDGFWMDVECASGGERVCAALCLRVALALVLSPKLSLIILDEPTHNMDATAVSVLSKALHDQLPRFVAQTFLITHDENLKESASSRIYMVDRDKDSGDKSIVEQLSAQ